MPSASYAGRIIASAARGLLGDLVQGAEDVRVVELDRPHPGQPAEHPGQLGAVHAAQLGHPQRQFAVAARRGSGRSARGAGTGWAAARPARRRAPSAGTCRRCSATSAPRSRTARACRARASTRAGSRPAVPASRMYSSRACRTAAPVGQPVRQPRADQRVGVEQAELTAELAVVVHGGLLADRSGERPRSEAPGHSPRGFGLRQRSARRDTLRRRRHAQRASCRSR